MAHLGFCCVAIAAPVLLATAPAAGNDIFPECDYTDFAETGEFDPAIPAPSTYFGHRVGARPMWHRDIIGYLKLLIRGASGASYNIGMDAEETSVAELAELVAEQAGDLWGYTGQAAFGRSSDISYLTDNPNRRCPDITKARTELGFSPKVTLKEGVRRSLTWYFHLQDDQEL